MKPWLYAFLSCQECSGELAQGENHESDGDELFTGTLDCVECQLSWPVLGGVPLMLHDPGAYLASYRESVLTSLVEHDAASAEALALVDEFCAGYQLEARRYQDDWTQSERNNSRASLVMEGQGALTAYRDLVREEKVSGLQQTVLKLLGSHNCDAIIEVGPGAGGLSRLLAERCDNLVLVDFSLRSLLCSQDMAAPGGAEVAAILGDVAGLELAADCTTAVVAANVVDLLDEPERFLIAASRWLVRRGELIVTTPEPSLGGDSDHALHDLMESIEYKIEEVQDGIPWLRVHSQRYSQLYWLQALRASILN